MRRSQTPQALGSPGPGRPSWSASARPFCLAVATWLTVAVGCGPPAPPVVPRFAVEGIEERVPVQGENLLGIRLSSSTPRVVVARLELTAPSGERVTAERRLQVPAQAGARLEVGYRAPEIGVHTGSLKVRDAVGGALYYAIDDLRLVVRPCWEFTQDRSYYTREEAIRFRARMNRTDLGADRVRVILRRARLDAGGGGAVGEVDGALLALAGSEAEGALPLAGLGYGQYELAAWLTGPGGAVDSVVVAFPVLAPASREVKLDRFSGSLLVDGAPFFPIGLYWVRAELLPEARRLGYNSGDYYYRLKGEQVAELMDAAGQDGIQILLELSDFIRGRPEPDLQAIDAAIARYRNHPALLAWYLIDEPEESGIKPEVTHRLYERLHRLDPYHPVYLVNNRPATYGAHVGASDVLAVDVYPIPLGPVSRVRERMQEARWCSLGRKPVWLIAQAFGATEHWPRPPTPAELRNMVYQGLVHGARGIFFYRHCDESERRIQPRPLRDEMEILAGELRALTPVLVEPESPQEIGLQDGDPGVDIALRQHQGDYYLLVVNTTLSMRRVRMELRGLPPLSRLEALGRSGPARLQDGRFEADLEALGTGAYRLETLEANGS